jgi:hypothetical protein
VACLALESAAHGLSFPSQRNNSTLVLVVSVQVKCIETAIELCFRLKQEVGSFALMSGTGFEKMDYLQCCKVEAISVALPTPDYLSSPSALSACWLRGFELRSYCRAGADAE